MHFFLSGLMLVIQLNATDNSRSYADYQAEVACNTVYLQQGRSKLAPERSMDVPFFPCKSSETRL